MSIALRAQALALLEAGLPIEFIRYKTELSDSTIYRIRRVAKERGYDPTNSPVFKDEYFEDAKRSGRPKILDEETEQAMLGYVETDRAGREINTYALGNAFGVSKDTAWRTLRRYDYRKRKPTWKPGLTEEMRAARLQFALDH